MHAPSLNELKFFTESAVISCTPILLSESERIKGTQFDFMQKKSYFISVDYHIITANF